jgi:hypothetical protein
MTRMTVCLVLCSAFAMVGAPAMAQTRGQPSPSTRSLAPGAAATLPNTFDSPVTRTAPLAAPVAMPTAGQVTEADMAEGALRAVIADLAGGRFDPELFTEELGSQIRSQLPTLRPVVQGFGAIGPIDAQGVANGTNQFLVTFENAVTQWVIGLNEDGRISALLFRPAPPVSSEPDETPTPDTEDPALEP